MEDLWRPFVRASLALAAIAGFGLGAGLFLVLALNRPIGVWWPAAAQAHGHVQLFGWAGMMVLGVGVHFLPRLFGVPLARPERARWVLWLVGSGLVLRTIAQPGLAIADAGPAEALCRLGFGLAGGLEWAGATVALWLLVCTVRGNATLRRRGEVRVVVPFFVTAFTGYWLALAVHAFGILEAIRHDQVLIPAETDRLSIQMAFHLFLVPISVAMSARTFPLYFRTPPPSRRLLHTGLAVSLLGFGLRVAGERHDVEPAAGTGQIVQGVALILFVIAIGMYAPRLPLPRRAVRPLRDPIQWHALTAYGWLIVAATVLVLRGRALLGGDFWSAPADAEWHALGAGFVTLLILGVGAHLLPGFARRPLRNTRLVWATLTLGNAAALLRVGPLVLGDTLAPRHAQTLMGLAGIAAIAALGLFGVNLAGKRPSTVRRRETAPVAS